MGGRAQKNSQLRVGFRVALTLKSLKINASKTLLAPTARVLITLVSAPSHRTGVISVIPLAKIRNIGGVNILFAVVPVHWQSQVIARQAHLYNELVT